ILPLRALPETYSASLSDPDSADEPSRNSGSLPIAYSLPLEALPSTLSLKIRGDPCSGASIKVGKGAGDIPSARQPWAALPAKAKMIFSFWYSPMVGRLVILLFVVTGHPSRFSPRPFNAYSLRLAVATKASGLPSPLISPMSRGEVTCSGSSNGNWGNSSPFSFQPYSLFPAGRSTTFWSVSYQS